MKKLSINYVTKNNLTKNQLNKIVEGSKSKKYNIDLVIHDFSLEKKNKDLINDTIKIQEHDYEDFTDHESIILDSFSSYVDSHFVSIVKENVVLDNIDKMCFEKFPDTDLIGMIYGDYTLNGVKCFLRSHYSQLKMGLPLAFWSTKRLIENISKENKLAILFSNYICIHIPENICYIQTDD